MLLCAALAAVCAAALAPAFAAEDRSANPARPTPEQAAWQEMELGMFIHFAPNTWQDQEGDDLSTPPDKINPTRLDTEQWADVAQALGARYVVFVAKHVGGFCWWQTETTDYSVKSTPWRGGKGDVLADLAASCRKRGLKLGVYLSPCDRKHGADVGGRCPTPALQEEYARLYRRQLTEVLSRYGEMCEVWFDGSVVVEVGDILKQHAPHAMIFQSKYATIRWVGNEDGVAPDPNWNPVLSSRPPQRWGVCTDVDGDPEGDRWLPNECDARIRRDWFWSSHNGGTLKSLDALMDMYLHSVGRGAVLLLNNTPDTTGRIPEADARRSAEFGAEIKRRFGRPVAEAAGEGAELVAALPGPTTVDHVVVQEDITRGQRVRQYVIEGEVAGQWRALATGTSIGHKKTAVFAPTVVTGVRLRCLETAATPCVRRLAVFSVADVK